MVKPLVELILEKEKQQTEKYGIYQDPRLELKPLLNRRVKASGRVRLKKSTANLQFYVLSDVLINDSIATHHLNFKINKNDYMAIRLLDTLAKQKKRVIIHATIEKYTRASNKTHSYGLGDDLSISSEKHELFKKDLTKTINNTYKNELIPFVAIATKQALKSNSNECVLSNNHVSNINESQQNSDLFSKANPFQQYTKTTIRLIQDVIRLLTVKFTKTGDYLDVLRLKANLTPLRDKSVHHIIASIENPYDINDTTNVKLLIVKTLSLLEKINRIENKPLKNYYIDSKPEYLSDSTINIIYHMIKNATAILDFAKPIQYNVFDEKPLLYEIDNECLVFIPYGRQLQNGHSPEIYWRTLITLYNMHYFNTYDVIDLFDPCHNKLITILKTDLERILYETKNY